MLGTQQNMLSNPGHTSITSKASGTVCYCQNYCYRWGGEPARKFGMRHDKYIFCHMPQEGQSGCKPTVSQDWLPKDKPLWPKGPVAPSWIGQAKQEYKLLDFDRIVEKWRCQATWSTLLHGETKHSTWNWQWPMMWKTCKGAGWIFCGLFF